MKSEPESSRKSLEEINNTVSVNHDGKFSQKLLSYLGPGLLVAVGYMDPGNWITSMQGGAQFGYTLLFVILLSSVAAMLLQSMTVRLGIATGDDLAQATRRYLNKPMAFVFWIIAELAIIATDIAEVIGSAIALDLLFHIPLIVGAIITVLDVFLLLFIMRFGFRKIEAIVGVLIFTVLAIFVFEVFVASPHVNEMLEGFLPSQSIITNHSILFIALGIVGATIMPHNLYLHSSIVQSRMYDRNSTDSKAQAIKYATMDSNIQLIIAFVINCLLLVLGAALFYGVDSDKLGGFYDLYHALQNQPLLGATLGGIMSTLFAVALLASGQNSTITGTIAGQIVMEGFIHLRLPNWARRLITRGLAILPIILCLIIYKGSESKMEELLVFSQVFLSIALPFSLIPLQLATNNSKMMGRFKNKMWVNVISWALIIILSILNIYLIIETFQEL
ncbi:Nramp family divalent metal transporter [Staphylococcus pettenkoferi]|uniref:Divalent metal cation transporter MntH n=1 Tax=Staphylococcus pettenkoferi TaxID=170573 RepID=A0ABT4BQF0_9STAP|nr:Nramp family divalent metal transporter [Staphylococcus pettenkoferi]MCY1564068.1 Nramp family divalent metal transporter [Staphylococcus pettenkoferi]MCY1571449.1 Nramp family divalent metal transporter [Staphylococcus pettenkoferi]MCY1583945.1 Nramp family divalent metal transporter [Staphylococcus pettenkoferi]MCY1590637.1 Nramp family divalent metal transporter [Staphylococcus pettenkoferi]MCY1592437.1 Nramp family divalent metal transporter [Staphylococcus pettenkoferi]